MIFGLIVIVLALVTIRLMVNIEALRRRVETLEERLDLAATPVADSAPAPAIVRPTAIPKTAPPPRFAIVEVTPPARDTTAPPMAPAVADIVDHPIAAEAGPVRARPGFEELFGRRLPIWGGGITLAVAGMLIVKYSIDAGLISPIVRVISGLLFGTALIGAAETALRFDARIGDDRVRQAFAGAGLATLYASVLIAANLYHLIAPLTGFIGLAAVTVLAMGLSLRFGAPSALLGLVGGMAAPALVGSNEPNIPLLATYLAVTIGGLCAVSRTRRWLWLGVGALVGGFGWGALLLAGGSLDPAASLAIGLYLALIGIAFPLLLLGGGNISSLIRFAGSGMAAIQIAILVAKGGFALLDWGLFGLISIAILWLSRREPMLARLPVMGLAIAALLLGAWPGPTERDLAIVLIAGVLIYAGPLLARIWHKDAGPAEAAQIAAIVIGALLLPILHFYRIDGSTDRGFAMLAFAAALLPAGAAALGWRADTRGGDTRFVLLTGASALLLAASIGFALPAWAWAPMVGLLALGLLALSFAAHDERVEYPAWAFGIASMILLGASARLPDEIARAVGIGSHASIAVAIVRWGGLAAIAGLFAWRARIDIATMVAQAVATVLAYGAIAQILPDDALPMVVAVTSLGLVVWSHSLSTDRLLPALATLLAITFAWALWPLGIWLDATGPSLLGFPTLVTNLPPLADIGQRLLGPAAIIAAATAIGRRHIRPAAIDVAVVMVAIFAGVAAHVIYKHLFLLTSPVVFIERGFGERTIWEALLFGAGAANWRLGKRQAALIVAGAGMAHFAFYSVLLDNPLWTEQAVGSLPVFNWLLPAYGVPMVMLWLIRRFGPPLPLMIARGRSIGQMALILLFAFACLRQIAHGTILSVPGVAEAEDIARSILAIAIAVGFLMWGISQRSRDWRIASLLLMLGAVGKVFLFDAAGLDGLARIGSFVALGLSLIGIGWLYSRYLKPEVGGDFGIV